MQIIEYICHFFEENQNLIIGLGVPIVIFLVQLWLWYWDHKTCDITLIENRNYIIDPSLSNRIEGLSISYKDKPIKNWLLYYQITIANSGTKDISRDEVISPFTLTVPDNVKLVSYKVIDQSEDLDFEIEVNGNALIIKWDLFKVDEYIRLDIVADYDSSLGKYNHNKHSLLSKITYNKSRIKDLKVQKANIRNYEILLRGIKSTVFVCLIPIFLLTIVNRNGIIKEVEVTTNAESITGEIDFLEDSVVVGGSRVISYPVIINGIKEKAIKRNLFDIVPRSYFFLLIYVWGFVILEQYRMRRKREKYGLVSGKTWNQFDIEDC